MFDCVGLFVAESLDRGANVSTAATDTVNNVDSCRLLGQNRLCYSFRRVMIRRNKDKASVVYLRSGIEWIRSQIQHRGIGKQYKKVIVMNVKVEPSNVGAVSLSELKVGQSAKVVWVNQDNPFASRLRDLGFVPGSIATVRMKAPWSGPVEYEIRGSRFCLRPQETRDIHVVPA